MGYSGRCHASCQSEYSGDYRSDKLHASSAYSVRGVRNIQNELQTKGPMFVAFTVYSDFPAYKSVSTSTQAAGVWADTLLKSWDGGRRTVKRTGSSRTPGTSSGEMVVSSRLPEVSMSVESKALSMLARSQQRLPCESHGG